MVFSTINVGISSMRILKNLSRSFLMGRTWPNSILIFAWFSYLKWNHLPISSSWATSPVRKFWLEDWIPCGKKLFLKIKVTLLDEEWSLKMFFCMGKFFTTSCKLSKGVMSLSNWIWLRHTTKCLGISFLLQWENLV